MSKDLVISKTLNELRACLTENGEILDFLLERKEGEVEQLSVGNIYLGRVSRVLPGMQSAFVDIGYEKAAFLYVNDAYIPSIEEQRKMAVKREKAIEEQKNKQKMSETIPDEMSTLSEISNEIRSERPIETFLKEGDQILVQVAKEPISTKGPRITRHITLAGRHVVFMPFIEHTGVSRRIENEKERDRLKEILDTIRPENKGIIARTVAEGQSYKVLKSDYDMLAKIWKEIQKKAKKVKAPNLCYQDLNFIQRIMRDILDEDVDKIIFDDKDAQKEADRFINKFLPSMKGKSEFYNHDETSVFEKHGIDLEIERALSNKVYLKSGGALVIDQTEALVSIDVNTGKFVGRKNLEETILKTNLEAVKEIAYQLRIRNCGGLIIIDFIDMELLANREQVYTTLLEALKKDRSKTKVMPISELGLVEMTRKRTRDTLVRLMCNSCPYCEGLGHVKTPETVSFEIIRKLVGVLAKSTGRKVYIYAHPEVTAGLCGQDTEMIDILEDKFGKELVIRSENNYHIEQYEIFPQNF